MTLADRLNSWNRWFDNTPESWRSHIVLWPLIGAGFVNMQLSIASAFPFGILVLLTLLAMAAIRLPYTRGWIRPGPTAEEGAQLVIGHANWAYDLNQRYDAMPEGRRFFVIPAILIVAGTLNLWLSFNYGWSFGGLFLLAVLAVIVVRAPYTWGVIAAPEKVTESALAKAWLYDLNRWYDDKAPEPRFWTGMMLLAALAAIDILLSSALGFSLALLIGLDLLALVAIRAPYVAGALDSPTRRPSGQLALGQTRQITADTIPPLQLGGATVAHVHAEHAEA